MDTARSDSQRLSGGEDSVARLTGTGVCEAGDKTVLGDVKVFSVDLKLGG